MRIGTVTFQANDSRDIFHVADVIEPGTSQSDEELIGIEDSQFESSRQFVTGHIPKLVPVSIDGDTCLVSAWFRGEMFSDAVVLRVYVEYEETEELLKVEAEEITEHGPDPLDPVKMHL
jgi:hypothetical protein